MALLIDKLRTEGLCPELDAHLPVLTIQNVADYMYHREKTEWFIGEIPNAAPPFDRFWAEYRHPHLGSKHGFLIVYTAAKPGWIATATAYGEATVDLVSGLWANPHPISFVVNSDGTIHRAIEVICDPDRHMAQSVGTWFFPVLLAVSFMHCKNVRVEDNRQPKALAKKWHGKYNLWPSPYKTLVIEPMKDILKREGKCEETGLKRALHICRGHFKDYREGPGLFGKHHVLVYQPSIVRGTKQYDQEDRPPRRMEILSPGAKTK